MGFESYSDGAGKNSSGHGAASFLIVKDKSIMHQESILLMGKTNNEAEYIALYSAINHLLQEGECKFTCYVDSELVCKQVNGDYVCKAPLLLTWCKKIKNLQFGRDIHVVWVPRENEYIGMADRLNRNMVRKL